MRKLLTAALAAASALALASPAGAATPHHRAHSRTKVTSPKRQPDFTASCDPNHAVPPDSSVWYDSKTFVVENPCTIWLGIGWGGVSGNGTPDSVLLVAPKTHFTWRVRPGTVPGSIKFIGPKPSFQWDAGPPLGDHAQATMGCDDGESSVLVVYSAKRVRPLKRCGVVL